MKSKYRYLDVGGALLDSNQLESHLQKLAANHILVEKSDRKTYPIPRLKDNLKFILYVYNILSEDIKNKIPIHPAGEWILDNFYIIDKNAKIIIKELNSKKYTNLVAVANGINSGFSRAYIIAKEIIAYTDGKINDETLKRYLQAYQNKKNLSMEELWQIPTFLQIVLIEKIREICETIYLSEMQKRKVDDIVLRLVEMKKNDKYVKTYKYAVTETAQSKYPFIEYMSYRLKKYGKKAYSYLEILENQIDKLGTTVFDCINHEHFDIAAKKISMGNCITSINAINRLNYVEIFNSINGVEDILNQDPCDVYRKMDCKTKEYYRSIIEKISKKTKISELYIAKKCVELAENCCEREGKKSKKSHVGYYLISEGYELLVSKLINKKYRPKNNNKKWRSIISISIISIILSSMLGWYTNAKSLNFVLSFGIFIFSIIPIKMILIKVTQYISGKIVKPRLIPKIDFYDGITEEYTTMVVIPTIVDSEEKVNRIMKKLEVYYRANQSKNLYFTLLGDCTSEEKEIVALDKVISEAGEKQCRILNEKYPDEKFSKFNFVYRKRTWCSTEDSYLGWERKRGLLTQFNDYLKNHNDKYFYANTFRNLDKSRLPKIKYIITLDSDTNLVLNTAFELVGAMAHILNKPIIDKELNIVTEGYGIIQPRVGIGLLDANKSLFTKIFSGVAGIDSYTNATSDFYYDNYDEGIYTGKGIYDLDTFYAVLKDEIPENIVLSHDLLEGCYLRCGLASDIVLMDGYPSTYNSYKTRLSRWIRGDYQIVQWVRSEKLNRLSKYKILDNIIRSLSEVSSLVLLILNSFVQSRIIFGLALANIIIPYIIEIFNKIIFKRNGELSHKKFSKQINGYGAIIIKSIIDIALIPDKAYISFNSGIKSLYRLLKSKKLLLEWTTAEEAERCSKNGVYQYYKNMIFNILFGVIFLMVGFYINSVLYTLLAVIWMIGPVAMNYISKPIKEKESLAKLESTDKEFVRDVAFRTWKFFKDALNEKSNYLPPDNYQEDRKDKFVYRTSPTNIGLALLSVVASYDLGFESKEYVINLLEKMITSIEKLPKWNGHLYNWYKIDSLEATYPKYVSSVDSGNFVGYLYILKQFLLEEYDTEKSKILISVVNRIIEDTDFSALYDEKNELFSIGFNVEENRMTESYYDLLASEARQTSFIAIAKRDIPSKHWKNLGRTLTVLNKYKGLISWSGTAFEYLMPTITLRRYSGSLLDESCKFMIMSQMEYAKKLGIQWGISEAAFNLKDFNGNYQYKAFGIPWLGLKRGLADEMVTSSYGTILAINDVPREVIKNLQHLKSNGMYNKYGFYESIDYTPGRVKNNENFSIVKTYMAHHQGLILLSIDNLINDNICQKRFFENPEIEAVDILLQERMPDNVIITKENKEKVDKIKYTEFDYYTERIFNNKKNKLNEFNLICSNDYSVLIDKNGNGYSKYKDKLINRYKATDNIDEGIHFYIKSMRDNTIWSPTNLSFFDKTEKQSVVFSPDKSKFSAEHQNIKSSLSVIVAPDSPTEIRKLELKNIGEEDEQIEVANVFEPVLSSAMQDYAHKAFNKLFISYELQDGIIVVKRKFRDENISDFYIATTLYYDSFGEEDLEFELDGKELFGRQNFEIPELIELSKPFSKVVKNNTNPVVAFRKSFNIKAHENVNVALIISASDNKREAINNVKKYRNFESIDRAIGLSKAQIEAKIQYLGLQGKQVNLYGRLLSNAITKRGKREQFVEKDLKTSKLWKFGISGDNVIIVVFIKNICEVDLIKQLVLAVEYYKLLNFCVDLVIVNEEQESYDNYVAEAINDIVSNHHTYSYNEYGKIYVLKNVSNDDKELLRNRANCVLYGGSGSVEFQLDEVDFEYNKMINSFKYKENEAMPTIEENSNLQDTHEHAELEFDNGYGGFVDNGREYIVTVNKNKKLPMAWSNVLANKNFGTVVTDSMGGYTWYKNSRLNRITSMVNDAVKDIPSESIFFYDCENGKTWSIASSPMPDDNDYQINYGLGYCRFSHTSSSIRQENIIFVPQEDSVKINVIRLKNLSLQKRKIRLVFYAKLAMDEEELKSDGYINLKYFYNNNIIIAKNVINDEFENYVYFSCSEKIKSYTGNKEEVFGSGNLADPKGIANEEFSNANTYNNSNVLVFNVDICLEAFGKKDIIITLGAEENIINCKNMAYKYANYENCYREYERVRRFWSDATGKIMVKTPNKEMDILVNNWLVYQTLCCRMYARTGYYQSGGAYGFRDQLQDVMSLKYINPEYTRNQIIEHSKHQFIEGDVLHWWHKDTKKGIRTRFSDDLLWLVYTTCDYIEYTNDYSILDEKITYLEGSTLDSGVDEKYDVYNDSENVESLYEHCLRAIKKACEFGEHGLPKIGSGDWNDGYSTVGNKGKGESVWLGFFLYDILSKFMILCKEKKDEENVALFEEIANKLKRSLNTEGWDGRWFRRAFCDDENILGTINNRECRIDSISQSWAVISGAADNDKKYIAMDSLENHLVDRYNGIIKLLDPPFENGNLKPGYIKAYLPGTRENGGQYTHAAIWTIIAESMLGFGDKAMEFLNLINPIEHSKTKILADRYGVEPYVIAADIYGTGNLVGVGGWTWYTGSSSWYYICVIKYILGLIIEKGKMKFNPCIPHFWSEFEVKYKFEKAVYNIKFKNPDHRNKGVKQLFVNGKEIENKFINLNGEEKIYDVVVIM